MPIYVPGKVVLQKAFTPESYMYEFPSIYPVWSPASLSTALWVDAADASTIIETGGAVSQWSDKSGNNRHATQTTTDKMPLRSVTGLNNRPSINFDGTNDNLNLPTGFLFNTTAVSVAFVLLGPARVNTAIFGSRDDVRGLEFTFQGSGTRAQVNDSTRFTSNLWRTDSQPAITIFQSNSTVSAGWKDGSTVVASNSAGMPALNYNGIYAFGQYASNYGSFFCNMRLSEFIISTSTWTTDQRQRVEGYLAHRWGLTANLPSDHPYKTVGPTS
jgi:hypothetical protein